MTNARIDVPYNHDLKPLEELLSGVRRPGDFFVSGSLEAPVPRVEVEGAGLLSFPVPAPQVQELIGQADRAPYGRGAETIVDTSVRKVWQLPPSKVRIGGKSWEDSFRQILSTVKDGLGCVDAVVSAELYKMLVYDAGGFFKAHRDTEKAEGMFGTLVVVLPSLHRGGELVIRHAGREATVDLASPETSELRFAAFYADCEHEVKPVTDGNRVCLVYNLIQRQAGPKEGAPLTAPLYDSETTAAANLLVEAFAESGTPAKLAWLLEHQYSPAELSFTTLKNADAALVKVLRQAAERAGCAVHLGIVHIEETGPAQPDYDSRYDRRSRWNRYRDAGDEEGEDTSSEAFEVIEISEASRYVDQWVDVEDRPVEFGKLPLAEGELLPAGALDDEDPDEQRLMEATGNEGASFERSYRRAAVVVWPRERFADVLLQAGIGAVLPHLKERVEACAHSSGSKAEREGVVSIASKVVDAWEDSPGYPTYRGLGTEPSRSEMIQLLGRLGEVALMERFVAAVVTRHYDGSENDALAKNVQGLGARTAEALFARLVGENMGWFHVGCVNLLSRLIQESGRDPAAGWDAALREVAAAIVKELPKIKAASADYGSGDWLRSRKAKPVDAAMVAELLESLAALNTASVREAACTAMIANPTVFDPGTAIVPALEMLHQRGGDPALSDADSRSLWRHAADFLLARSEHPPEPPKDLRQEVKISCDCEDCRELQKFALDPGEQVHRFRVRQDRRQHLENKIVHHNLDITAVTERKGSPQTLVCTKTRRTHHRRCDQHKADRASMSALLRIAGATQRESATLATRMAAARGREPLR